MTHAVKVERLLAAVRAADAPLGLAKDTSNLFRDRQEGRKARLDVRDFTAVLAVDTAAGWVEAEGMVTYEHLVDACLPHGVMPAVVPELKSITLGGAAAGVGIEASSFRYGLVHETLAEIEVLLPDGRLVVATPDNAQADLFFGFPNSYGTLGYALRLRARVVPVRPYVRLTHHHYTDPAACFAALERLCAGEADFLDGVVFGPREFVLTEGHFVGHAPYTSDYGFEHIYYRSLRERDEDYLSVRDFIWRWDTDWFWCSNNLGLQNPILRRLVGRKRLNSVFYTKLMRLNSRWRLTHRLDRLMGWHRESVIQDVDIPIAHAAEFLDFLLAEIGILPVWLCPIRPQGRTFTLYPMRSDTLYVNFGFWDVVRRREAFPPGHHNRLIEAKVMALGGIKSLYSDSYYDQTTFWRLYDGAAYRRLKARYDPHGRARDLYQKCVLRQ
ncbi:MAG: FAD-binding oxidoreductase [Thiobacillaceae bacterium]|nr:FAD-binding oxidoreductase [Thiobacillaceae bacterium]